MPTPDVSVVPGVVTGILDDRLGAVQMVQSVAMADVFIRVAVPADLAAQRDVFRRSSLSNEGDRASLLAHPEALTLSDIAVREQRTRVALADGEVVGFATTRIAENVSELEDLFVDPDWMWRGIGRELVLDAVAIARANGVPRVDVTANGHALGFYKKIGFVLDGAVDTRFGSEFRMHLDVFPSPADETAARTV